MRPENKAWLEENKGIWQLFKADQIMRNGFDADKALKVVKEEFEPKANYCTWCPADKGNLITFLYTQYEKWEKLELEKNLIIPKDNFRAKKNAQHTS